MRINVLEPKIYNKIAAGEVVERPASIVKEMVENSIDAKSTNVTVEIENGGITKIRVTDNGCGIHYDDLKIAFMPHATSKIKGVEDLDGIESLGFRGEALASIGSVSIVSLTSKTPESSTGGNITIEGGDIKNISECGAKNGTDIVVTNLFYNVPARAKFLKKPKTEENEITSLMSKLILANPIVSFKYIVDGKLKFMSSGKGIKDAIFVVYGKEALDNCEYFEKDYGDIKVYGYLGRPEFAKPNRSYQSIFVNNRYITNSTIQTAVHNAYGDILMKKQFPFYVLYLDIDYTRVDVNVHPNKMEVRFDNSNDIYSKVFGAINKTLNKIDYTKTIEEKEDIGLNKSCLSMTDMFNSMSFPSEVVIEEKAISNTPVVIQSETLVIDNKIDYNTLTTPSLLDKKEDENLIKERRNIFSALEEIHTDEKEEQTLKSGVSIGSKLLSRLEKSYEDQTTFEIEKQPSIATELPYKIVGTAFNCFIMIELNDELLVIDQHAGHERILFDKFMAEIEKGEVYTQQLLIPYILSVNSAEENLIAEKIDDLTSLGFDIALFGDGAYKVNAVPMLLNNINLAEFFKNLLDEKNAETKLTLKSTIKDRIASLACKSAIKGGDSLSELEIKSLIASFAKNNTQLLCPHGRPIIVKLTKNQIEKWFKRVL